MRPATLMSVFATGTIALLCLGSSAQAQNLLTNGNMDAISVSGQDLATPTGWTAFANKASTGPFTDAMSSEPWCNVADVGGYGVFFKPFSGGALAENNRVSAFLYQDVPATVGQNYSLTGWAGAESGYVGLTDATVGTKLTLQFLSGTNSVISQVVLDLATAGLGVGPVVAPATGFNYTPFTVTGVAPAGAVSVRSMASMIDAYGGSGAQALVFDAFSLVVPEPTSLASVAALSLLARRRRPL